MPAPLKELSIGPLAPHPYSEFSLYPIYLRFVNALNVVLSIGILTYPAVASDTLKLHLIV
jgi:hypothetical protein